MLGRKRVISWARCGRTTGLVRMTGWPSVLTAFSTAVLMFCISFWAVAGFSEKECRAVVGLANAFLDHVSLGIAVEGQHRQHALAVQIGPHNGPGQFFTHIFGQDFRFFTPPA